MYYDHLDIYLRRKKVYLVGGANNSFIKGFGDCLIATTNNHASARMIAPDIIFSGGCEPIDFELLKFVSVVCHPFKSPCFYEIQHQCIQHEIDHYVYSNERYMQVNEHGCEFEHWNAFNNRLGTKPFTGISAIKMLLDYPIAELYITGMNFYQQPGRGIPYKRGPHLIEPQRAWLAEVAHFDKRVKLDDTLQKICTYQEPEEKSFHFIREGDTLWHA